MAEGEGGSAPLQLIDSRGEFSSRLEEFTAALGGPDQADETLLIVSALGVKGSGKSSLLNDVFGTSFGVGKTFNASKGTKGIWIQASANSNKPLAVMDTQGSDGRGADMEKVNRIATFTLCFSDVLVFSLWYADIGRYEAAGYGLVRTVFQEYLKLFGEERRRTMLMFVVHDHDDGTSIESVKQILETDLKSLWQQAMKPAGSESLQMGDLFDLEFVSLPHPRHRQTEYEKKIGELRSRFCDESSPSYVLKDMFTKMVPINALHTYPAVTWRDLARGVEVENPTRRDLVAAYRCDVAYHTQYANASKQMNKWKAEVEGGKVVRGFGAQASQLIESRIDEYENATSMHANSQARAKKGGELNTFLKSSITSLFQKQMQLLQTLSLIQFKDLLLNSVVTGGGRNSTGSKEVVLDSFSKKAEECSVAALHLSFHSYKETLKDTLTSYAQQFEDSPTVQLSAMQRYERRAQRPIRRQPNANIGLNLTGALRPRGFGNFQLVTGYSDGPLVMNFSVCNDADAAEQEGQGSVPLFRLQPTLHYDLDL
uniref:GB1/RHD3-type G domain-containing protein n=2 Tax=Rhodosorus marinus TaxID=101924 RepID=A0A7S3A2V0_9RHOD|mmetsp:Transcript_40961/g.162192  ORF Transcript_40961/g.162192 Transcript_40961/m.162192 type:complete len:541 (+) Transcript_40961:172-1794(+)